ncbi:MAG: response regulator [Candidatus Aureabacteria bacterium]|nr:response regulator [Candidatus Auribacterota bacterium]
MTDQKDYSGPERRKYTRISFSFPVRFKEYKFDERGMEKEGVTQYAYSNDISLEGIKLKFLESVGIGKYLKLKLTLPVENSCIVIHTSGEVMWSQYSEEDKVFVVGVKFIKMDDDDRSKLEEFIKISRKEEMLQPLSEEKKIDYLSPERIVRHFNRPIKVLVVDDEKNVRYILNLKLTMKKMFAVEQAEDSEQAFERIQENRPDIILLDIMLPGIDGFQICRRLKETPETKDIPVIFLTAKNQVKDVIRGIRAGVDDYITKPYEFDELFYQMIKVLDSTKSVKRIIAE